MASIDYKNKLLTAFDESIDTKNGVRQVYKPYADWLAGKNFSQLVQKSRDAELLFRRVGITFAVYGEEEGAERLIPFDVIPRILAASEWGKLSEGACQR
ncbi:MAG: circularly permuted type 2 ATP-grasp protein, partial [Methylotenera sp.]|nr:circularly permuted type 2 ATP-grasp protein [Methylotenera sp.]